MNAGGSPGSISRIFSFTRSMTSLVFSPTRATITPPTASELFFTKAAVRKASPICTLPKSFKDRGTVFRGDDDVANVVKVLDQSQSTHNGPGAVLGDHISADIRIAGHDRANDCAEGQSVAAQAVGIDINLVLLHGSADARDLRNSRT